MNSAFSRTALRSLAVAAVISSIGPASADDRDLLKFRGAKPYLFILLDSSGSMNLKIGAGRPAGAGPRRRPGFAHLGRQGSALQVFHDVDDVQFGFAAMNHDTLARGVGSLALLPRRASVELADQGTSAGLTWPLIDADGLTTDLITVDTDGDGTADAGDGVPDDDVEGDTMVFGTAFTDASGSPLAAGTCALAARARHRQGPPAGQRVRQAGADRHDHHHDLVPDRQGRAAKKVYRLEVVRPGQPSGRHSPTRASASDNLPVQFKLVGPGHRTAAASRRRPPTTSTSGSTPTSTAS